MATRKEDKRREFETWKEELFGDKQNYFKNGRIDQAALVSFIKDIKKNTSLSDEDAATLAASKVMTHHSTLGT